ncbi:1683_t:CDS:1 [Ambispora gerdemannii]|uniref:1683_t:CDS:1 n=1 Tax=Ambispora gerdemannii TaxID=144530 RepID=A0A9N9CWD4_9GLOM|nr:1683_t:CDS:1 [Ambispora gerdemannii]
MALTLWNRQNKRIILLIGRTGSGKSTLANVLTDSDNFKENAGSLSGTRENQVDEFDERLGDKVIKFRVIDTVGFGDTHLTDKEVLNKIAEASNDIKDGLNQIFFVITGKLTKEEIHAFRLLTKIIFSDTKIVEYITIVRTHFTEFEDEDECEEDRQNLQNELGVINIIYVDNPPLKGRLSLFNQSIREESRKRLLAHLVTCKNNYKPKNLKTINDRIDNYVTETQKLRNELDELKKLTEEQQKVFAEQIRLIEEKLAKNRCIIL